MNKYFLIITNTNVYNRQFITLSKSNFDFEINKEDYIYISEKGIIETLWKLNKKDKERYRIEKIKVVKDGCKFLDLNISKKNNKKTIYINNEQDIQYLSRVFQHKIKIYPQYNINNILDRDLEFIIRLKRCDPEIEFYYNSILDNSQKASVAIIPTYGVCIVENFIEKFLGNINTNIDIVLEKLKQNKTLYRDEQLNEINNSLVLSKNNKLNIKYKKYIICDDLNENQISMLNNLLEDKLTYIEFVTTEIFMNKLLEMSKGKDIVIDEQKKYGIKCALMPQYVIKKSLTTFRIDCNGKIQIPKSSIELDDEQIRILDELNERTYIESTAGTGKSALLLTKAYMMANENKNKNFLLICYNNKLCEELENEAKYKNQQAENLQVRTFDKFIQENFSNTNDFIKNHSEFLKKVRNRRFFKNLRWNFYR